MNINFIHSRKLLLEPVKESTWASEMVLNPAVIQDKRTGRLHMLFRATGPYPQKQLKGKPLPYPISLGYGFSDDGGETWQFDLERPALEPKAEYCAEKLYIMNANAEKTPNYANGTIEDPRLFYFEEHCYMITACRLFPPGPYWEHDEPMQCAPEWARETETVFGKAATENYTVNVLWRVDLDRLTIGDYERAFVYITNLTNPVFGEDRDVVIFPERLNINGEKRIVMLQRPYVPENYPVFEKGLKPSVVICSADSFEEFANPTLPRAILAKPQYTWEENRIGTSAPPIKIGEKEWLLSYHGKQDETTGYTQSFMILKEQDYGYPIITHRSSERLICVEEEWEMPNKFSTPCIFTTGLVKFRDTLLMTYGAADERVGQLKINCNELVQCLKNNFKYE